MQLLAVTASPQVMQCIAAYMHKDTRRTAGAKIWHQTCQAMQALRRILHSHAGCLGDSWQDRSRGVPCNCLAGLHQCDPLRSNGLC